MFLLTQFLCFHNYFRWEKNDRGLGGYMHLPMHYGNMSRVVTSLREFPEFNSGNVKLNSGRRSHSGMNNIIEMRKCSLKMLLHFLKDFQAAVSWKSGDCPFLRR